MRAWAIAVFLLVLCGCARDGPSACQGLVYKETGLNRREYVPCARAMVTELDRFHLALKAMGDTTLPMEDRKKARTGCLASNARLVKLIDQAGGRQKLAWVEWEDSALNRLNQDILAAQTLYLMECYYGVGAAKAFNLAEEDRSHVDARNRLALLQ